MRKIIILVFILTLGAGLAGCGKKEVEQVKSPVRDSGKPGLLVVENNTLMGWLRRGKVVECKLDTPEGEIVMRVKNNNVRIDGIAYAAPDSQSEETASGTALTIGDTMYLWSGSKGTKMNLKKLEEMSGDAEENNNQETWEEMVADWEEAKINYNCKETTVPDSLFIPPANVDFMDFTALMDEMTDFGKKMQESIEAGEIPDMKEFERKMKEMQEQFQE